MASSDAALVGIREELTCPLCLFVFTDPKTLPCLHSFCTSCISDHIAATGKHGRFECPICKTDIIIPPGGVRGLKDNFQINNIATLLPSEECSMCPIHPDQEITMFCNDCEMPSCTHCMVDHKEHEMVQTHDINQRNNKEVDQLFDSVTAKLNFIDTSLELLTEQRDLCNKEEQRVTRLISEHFQEAEARLRKMKESLVNDAKAKMDVFRGQLDADITNMEERRKRIKGAVKHVKTSREFASVHDKLSRHKYFVNRLRLVNDQSIECSINEPAFDVQTEDVSLGLKVIVKSKHLDLKHPEDRSWSSGNMELSTSDDSCESIEHDTAGQTCHLSDEDVRLYQESMGGGDRRSGLRDWYPMPPKVTGLPNDKFEDLQLQHEENEWKTGSLRKTEDDLDVQKTEYRQVLPSTSPRDMNKQPMHQNLGPPQNNPQAINQMYFQQGRPAVCSKQPRPPATRQHRPAMNMNNQVSQQQYQTMQVSWPPGNQNYMAQPQPQTYMMYNPGQAMNVQQSQYVSQPQNYSMATTPPYYNAPQPRVYYSQMPVQTKTVRPPSQPAYQPPRYQVPQKRERKPILVINPETGKSINDDLASTTSSTSSASSSRNSTPPGV